MGTILLFGCSNIKTVNAFEEDGYLIVDKSEFQNKQTGTELNEIIITSNYARSPILLRKTGSDTYEAYLLECTYQHEKLDVEDDGFVCPANECKYDKNGKIITGLAKRDLKRFNIDKTITKVLIKID